MLIVVGSTVFLFSVVFFFIVGSIETGGPSPGISSEPSKVKKNKTDERMDKIDSWDQEWKETRL